MSNFTLQAVTRYQVTKQATRQAIAAGARHVVERLRREQTGQDILEYTGMIVLVAGVVALMFAMQIPQNIATALANGINAAFQSGHKYTPPPTLTVPNGG